ncbi:MAG TPA: arsenite methyltransferase [Terriglobales bacterium]|nr:arsenite methyltransferase [Terriglobales bacterium]
MKTKEDITQAVQERYGEIARGQRSGCGCGTPGPSKAAIGYSAADLELAGQANLGLGCGNPLALADLQPGMTVLDLGSGAGFDAFLAWRRVGPAGRVIGVDMTDDMLALARKNAADLGAGNVEFRKGQIERLPVDDAAVDFVISNCVINLSADKPAVFREVARVLKPGGRFAVSDLVLLRALPAAIAADVSAYVGCVAGASLMGDYVRLALQAGLTDLSIPQMSDGNALAAAWTSDLKPLVERFGEGELRQAASALVSIRLHGRKPAATTQASRSCCG